MIWLLSFTLHFFLVLFWQGYLVSYFVHFVLKSSSLYITFVPIVIYVCFASDWEIFILRIGLANLILFQLYKRWSEFLIISLCICVCMCVFALFLKWIGLNRHLFITINFLPEIIQKILKSNFLFWTFFQIICSVIFNNNLAWLIDLTCRYL